MDQNPTQIEQRIANLPEDVRQAVLSVEWEEKVRKIGERHQLHIDQQGALGDTTLMAMLGMFDLSEFAAKLSEALTLPADQGAVIAKEVSDEVFMPIRESLRSITTPKAGVPGQPTPQTPQPPQVPQRPQEPARPQDPQRPQTPPPPQPPATPKPDLGKVDAMLNTSTVTTMPPPATPTIALTPATPPAATKLDPYREPPV